jgi:glycosyltransferase involved in cell wall biosynthesis
MPIVWEDAPVILSVAGADLPIGLARTLTHPNLRVFGAVPEVWPLLEASRLAVAPLRYGAGIKGKVLEAWAAGLPCAMTPIAAEGLPLVDTVESDAAGLARLILALCNDPRRNAAAARAGHAALRRHFSQKRVDSALAAAIGGCARAPSYRDRTETSNPHLTSAVEATDLPNRQVVGCDA